MRKTKLFKMFASTALALVCVFAYTVSASAAVPADGTVRARAKGISPFQYINVYTNKAGSNFDEENGELVSTWTNTTSSDQKWDKTTSAATGRSTLRSMSNTLFYLGASGSSAKIMRTSKFASSSYYQVKCVDEGTYTGIVLSAVSGTPCLTYQGANSLLYWQAPNGADSQLWNMFAV